MHPSTLTTWAKGYKREFPGRAPVVMDPVITAVEDPGTERPKLPFIGLVEATVVQAFRRTALPLQRIRRAIAILDRQGELDHALASKMLMTDGANVLYNYAREEKDGLLSLLTVVGSGQRVYAEIIAEYLERISFGDTWATELVVPVTPRKILRVEPDVANSRPLFIASGAPLEAIRDRAAAGEQLGSIARDFETPEADIREAIDAIWPSTKAA